MTRFGHLKNNTIQIWRTFQPARPNERVLWFHISVLLRVFGGVRVRVGTGVPVRVIVGVGVGVTRRHPEGHGEPYRDDKTIGHSTGGAWPGWPRVWGSGWKHGPPYYMPEVGEMGSHPPIVDIVESAHVGSGLAASCVAPEVYRRPLIRRPPHEQPSEDGGSVAEGVPRVADRRAPARLAWVVPREALALPGFTRPDTSDRTAPRWGTS